MHSNNVFQYSKIRTRKRNAKKSIKTEKKIGIQPFLESGIHWAGIRNPVVGIRNPQRGIQNPRLSWFPLHGAINFLFLQNLSSLMHQWLKNNVWLCVAHIVSLLTL